MSKIEFRDIVKRFGDTEVIPCLNLGVAAGRLTVLLGPSGCGKSTILRMIAGLESPDAGSILLNDVDITNQEPRQRNMAMVFQNYALYPHLTVRQNLEFPLKIAKVTKEAAAARVAKTSELLGLTPMLDRYPRTLSGGERQRTALGRAIIREPAVFLFDEPLSNLDFQLRNQMRGELKALQLRLAKTAVYVTHDQTEAMTMADELVVLNQGRIMQKGSPSEVYSKPANLFVARFIGSPPMNFVDIDVEAGVAYAAGSRVAIATVQAPAGRYRLGIRPDQISTSPAPGGWQLSVTHSEFYGAATYLIGKIGDSHVMALNRLAAVPKGGESVSLQFDPGHLHLFDADSGLRISL